ncbi:MAG: HEAT repeat domain-containing protein [bacterium]
MNSNIRTLPVSFASWIAICLIALPGLCQAGRPAKAPPVLIQGPIQWEKSRVPQALVVNGLWSKWFRVTEALDKAGFRRRGELKNLSACTVIVLVNASAVALKNGDMENIREFVNQGGGLVVLGGLAAYGNGAYDGTPLEEILPVSLHNSYIEHFASSVKGARLTPSGTADWPMKFDFKEGPTAYYFHALIPTNGARVQVNVGGQPAIVSGTFGKGRVVACALTINGEPEPGVMPFWDWQDWPAMLGQSIEWAAGARPAGTVAAVSAGKAAGLKPLTSDELRVADFGSEKLPKDFVKRAVANPGEDVATVLFNLAVPESGDAKCGLGEVLSALLPYARPEWAVRLKAMADDMEPNIETRNAALVLLGACHDPDAYVLLLKALKNQRTLQAALDGLGQLGKAEAIPILKSQFESALKPARLPDGPDRWKPMEFSAAVGPAAHAAVALYRLGDQEAITRLIEFSRSLNLYRRILWNSTKVWPKDPVGQKNLKARIEAADKFQEAWEFVGNNLGPIPAPQADAFLRYAMTADDPVMIELLADAIEKSAGRMPAANWAALAGAKSGLIAKIAKSVIAPAE